MQETKGKIDTVERQIQHLTNTISNHQKLLEQREKEARSRNLIIVGLDETDEPQENTPHLLNVFFKEKLNVENVNIVQARRLGRKQEASSKPRPVHITFQSQNDRSLVLSNRSKLAGSKIFINYDLTKEQMLAEKHTRDLKKRLAKHPDYQGKRITISRNKILVDGIPVSDDTLSNLK